MLCVGARSSILAAAFDHAQGVAAFATRLAGQLVHQGSHEKDAAAADTEFGRIEVRHGAKVERRAFIEQANLDSIGKWPALDLKLSVGMILMGVTDDVVDGFVRCQDGFVGRRPVEVGVAAHGFNECAGQAK
jgi:hypothetical protein